ncbi:MAG: stage 0 sporulation family protein [Oscillospiraceae bacterium]|nr:stage 0 sporulation family protein [Oscillospiraceae bacterium]
MVEIIGVRFKNGGKIYYFSPKGKKFKYGTHVIVETARGIECGTVALENRQSANKNLPGAIKPIIREATPSDLETVAANKAKEKDAFAICSKKINEHNLKMKLVNVEYTFDNKILFYFTSEGRVDFRELVKDLAATFRTRIELRQIGVRDESKLLGGLGICGRPFCCSSFLGDFHPVSIKMAKEQNLSLNPTKISGTCGRLMCCLKYEQNVYEELLKTSPKLGAYVETPDGKGNVVDLNLLTGTYRVKIDGNADAAPHTFNIKDIRIIRDTVIKVDSAEMKALKDLEKE